MSEEPAQIAREARSIQQGLKELLKTRDPWDREVEFQRKNLRRHYLRLLFVYSYAAESRDIDTQLWIATSYQFISKYKERHTALERAIYDPARQQQQQQQEGAAQQQGRQQQQRIVEQRKLLQRFRQYLSEEEKFWVQLIFRIRRVFALDDAQGALDELANINIVPEDTAVQGETPKRNQHQFPPEADAIHPITSTATPEQRQSRIAILSKALICLGDIERYKEQYNEAGGRPRAGHEDGPPASAPVGRGGRGKRGGAANVVPAPVVPRMRNYEKAERCYKQARLLLPHDGNAWHQLAVLKSYQKETFDLLVYYYRAICVRTPYDTALDNMHMTLGKALDAWKKTGGRYEKEKESEEANGQPSVRLRVEAFKEKVVVVHALWQFPHEDPLDGISQKVIDEFRVLISERHLPPKMIWRVIVLAQGALWKHRDVRHKAARSRGSSRRSLYASDLCVESQIAGHLLALYRVLLEVGVVQLAEPPPEDAGELAQSITAPFRRMLPALRLSSKWVRANYKYILQSPRPHGVNGNRTDALDSRNRPGRHSSAQLVLPGVQSFWSDYTEFFNALLRKFPLEKLPDLKTVLEEDVEMIGFLPFKDLISDDVMTSVLRKGALAGENPPLPEGLHPNEEFLMRIKELLRDAKALADRQDTPVRFSENKFSLVSETRAEVAAAIPQDHSTDRRLRADRSPDVFSSAPIPADMRRGLADLSESEEDNRTDVTRTDDDPVSEAFHRALNGSQHEDGEEEEDEIILFNPRLSTPPQPPMLPPQPDIPILSNPTSPPAVLLVHELPAPQPPLHGYQNFNRTPTTSARPLGTTAADILNLLQRPSGHTRAPSTPLPLPGLFGLGTSNSIWSTEHDNLQAPGRLAGPSLLPTRPPPLQAPLQFERSQNSLLPTSPLIPSHVFSGAHQRTASFSPNRSNEVPSRSQDQFYGHSGSHLLPTDLTSVPHSASVSSASMSVAYADRMLPTSDSMLRQQQTLEYQHLAGHLPRDARIGQTRYGA
ncbi:uncharacterized protein LAESUDRAFT_486112 [Laetiporus sulphureus 93-53]|uniref:DNA/RNA-binding domain-containing protein n=1 Tax=Laetiporus sulphureus 93-53 TaxID=1314785 RepID=A0A165BN38_9APHY|nr:uncharacterized protein LAESUDRAFT_486112 [Laetiporus sulphureus 93-53]KZT01341.1 hypothetical protein LAESUDRAFT_486112 [Laetiporus sulphureus 93-53]